MQPETTSDFNNIFDSLRKNLLDMGLRNNLLNFKEIKRTISIVDEDLAELFDILVLKKEDMGFLPKKDDLKSDDHDKKNNIWQMPTDFDNIPLEHKDLFLQTDLSESELQKRLFSLFQYCKNSIQEFGYNTVYLALGFLEWKESDYEADFKKAPLILIPITIYRKSVGSPFKIYWTEDDISLNISLKHKLLDQSVNLPTDESITSKDELYKYLAKVNESIKSKPDWHVTNQIYISTFNFKKFIMYKDLDLNNWSDNLKNEEIGKLFGFNSNNMEFNSFDVTNIDNQLEPLDTYNVVDADSSQIAVIEDVKAGQSLVVEGPPGTGKSQTIVNLIAELLANKKSVLFVSEKRAALEVVNKRMENIGLDKYCLNLYDNSTNPKNILNDLNKVLFQDKITLNDYEDYDNLKTTRDYLNGYMDVLQSQYANTNLTIYELIGLYEYSYQQLESLDQKRYKIQLPSFKNITNQEQGAILNNIDKIAQLYNLIEPVYENPWRYTDCKELSPDNIDDIQTKSYEIDNNIEILLNTLGTFCENIGINAPESLQEVSECIQGSYSIISNRNYDEDKEVLKQLVFALENYHDNYNFKVSMDNINIEQINDKLSYILTQRSAMAFSQEILLQLNVQTILNDYITTKENINSSRIKDALNDKFIQHKFKTFMDTRKSFTKFLNKDYKETKKELMSYFTPPIEDEELMIQEFIKLFNEFNKLSNIRNKILPYASFKQMSDEEIVNELGQMITVNNELSQINDTISKAFHMPKYKTISELQYYIDLLSNKQQLIHFIEEHDSLARNYFNSWSGLDTNISEVKKEHEDLEKFIETHDIVLSSINQSPMFKENMREQLQTIQYSYNTIMNDYNDLNGLLNFSGKLKKSSIINIPIIEFDKEISNISSNISSINNWVQFNSYCNKYSNDYTFEFIELIKEDKIKPDAIKLLYEFNYANNILKEVYEENEILKSFNSAIYENNIETFKYLDLETIKLNKYRVCEVIDNNKPDVSQAIMPTSPLGILLHEINKKRKHKPIRQLLTDCRDVIIGITPCFLMTPLSIAQYLDPKEYESFFDYIIIDEASQVKVEDAIGALLRAKNYVIMGDTKQLPPTSFFDVETNVESDEEVVVDDIESILHFSKTVLPYKMLKYHYRSRHESLISVSNKEFYNNELYVYPSATIDSDELGLKFKYNPDSVYDRGESSTNKLEAEDVINYAIEHYKKYGDEKSLGIGTFSVSQKNMLLEVLEVKLKENPQLEKYFNNDKYESFFIKNIESIQGDERDVILISVGYGFDKDGNLSLNFGPLNKIGGERRLNVLTTRSKEKCVIFSNFKSADMHLTSKTPYGVQVLKTYLYYAEHKEFPKNYITEADFDSDFEKAVYNFLINEGYQVAKQVGCAGYKIDLAIVNPENADEYILAIECDGASYHSSSSARERDRLRQNILEGLGWKFHRVWSTDWYYNQANAKEILLKAITDAIEYDKNNKQLDEIKNKAHVDSNQDKLSVNTVEIPMQEAVVEAESTEEVQEEYNPKVNFTKVNKDDVSVGKKYVYYENEIYCNNFDEVSSKELLLILAEIIKTESPIHKDELYNRVKTVYNVKKTRKFKEKVDEVLHSIELINKGVYNKEEFYFNKDVPTVARIRNKPNIDFIAFDEIVNAINQSLMMNNSLHIDDLLKQVSLLFGFKALSKKTSDKINEIVYYMKFKGMIDIDEKKYLVSLIDTDKK